MHCSAGAAQGDVIFFAACLFKEPVVTCSKLQTQKISGENSAKSLTFAKLIAYVDYLC